MPADNFGKCGAEGVDVEPASEAHGKRNVIGRREWIELVNEPQPLLRRSERVRDDLLPHRLAYRSLHLSATEVS